MKHTKASFSPTSTDSLYLQVAQMPRSQDLAIILWTIMTTAEVNTIPLVHARRVITAFLPEDILPYYKLEASYSI